MDSGEDAGALASPARETKGDVPAAGADGDPPAAGGQADAPAAGAGDRDAPAAGAGDGAADGERAGGSPRDADADAGADAGAGSGQPPADPGRRAGAPVWAGMMAVLLALLIAAAAVAAVFLGRVRGADARSSRRQAAVAAARNAVADLTTADYRDPQRYLDKLKGDATGKFLSLFTNSAAGFADVLVKGKVQTTGNVVDVGVQRIGPDTAQLSVLADVTVKNSQAPNGTRRAYRLSVSMISAGSRWLVSNVEFVQ